MSKDEEYNGQIVVFDHKMKLPLSISEAEKRPNFRYIGVAYDQHFDVVAVRWISDNPANVGHFVHTKYLRIVPNWAVRNGLCTNLFMDTITALESTETTGVDR